MWWTICSNFPFLASKANTWFSSSSSVSFSFTIELFYRRTRSPGMGGPPTQSFQPWHTPVRYFPSVCILCKLVTRGHQQCVSRQAGWGWGQHVRGNSQSSVYNQMWTEEHCQASWTLPECPHNVCECEHVRVHSSESQGKWNHSSFITSGVRFSDFWLLLPVTMICTIFVHNLRRE